MQNKDSLFLVKTKNLNSFSGAQAGTSRHRLQAKQLAGKQVAGIAPGQQRCPGTDAQKV
jgi:hypothetical protein